MDKAVLSDLIDEYLGHVTRFVDLIMTHIEDGSPLQAVAEGRFPRTGRLFQNHFRCYSFHGVGCSVELDDGTVVDFDFEADGEIRAFDAWRIWRFAQSKGLMVDLPSVKKLFGELCADGVIVCKTKYGLDGRCHLAECDKPPGR